MSPGLGIGMGLGVGVIGVEGVWFLGALRWGGDLRGVIGVLVTESFGVEEWSWVSEELT